METVEVVIEIPQGVLNTICAYVQSEIDNKNIISDTAYKAIANGTILPKGHGKLIDSNVLWDAFQDLGQDFYEAFDFAEANAVIEADEEEKA